MDEGDDKATAPRPEYWREAGHVATNVRLRAVRLEAGRCSLADLCESAELLRVLSRLLEGVPILGAFGPASDWSTDSNIGRAVRVLMEMPKGEAKEGE